ncbi:DNA-binding of Mlu1-box binding protein MBP1 [Glarea lozoyensis ATCC 20868]|uniref:DNA-binding of Mlu1-box binding protein MBP1 n=1 Tax=Glarea lozoyensis (strain ATCC 20868 / MF5171) TaxID=1116229 RepID=S3DKX5_GLAL2|nr:DNA-binding of Mlu1-box binding protein MBP1 [Glarea lozoyensis ATCC 20868]EPE32706.1 DNA-binding of Mlu1-box binding protein MBP1 [Glarea lozoyensis ATCC 20868]
MVEKEPPFITLLPSPNNSDQQEQPSIQSAPPVENMYHHPSQMSAPQSPPQVQQPSQADNMHRYPPPQGEIPQSPQTSNQYPQYSYDIQLRYPQGEQQAHPQNPQHHYPPPPGPSGLPLPSMSQGLRPLSQAYPPPPQQEMPPPDTTGQIAPPGARRPSVTATLWEDEGTLCFQVDVNGTCVARREDNHMINGTKLLNVAGMTRGRRDGILKAERQKHVVKIGPMHLKGVWIPFEKALEFANRERITEKLYPLFVHNIGALLYHPANGGGNGGWARRESVQSQQSNGREREDYANDQRLASEQLHAQQQQRMYEGFPAPDQRSG